MHSIDSNNVTPEHRVRSLTIRDGQSQTTIRWPAGCLRYPVEIGMRDRSVISGFTLLLPVWGSRHKTTERNHKMATRSNINVKVGDVYHCIYCHWDGYPSHHSPIWPAITTPKNWLKNWYHMAIYLRSLKAVRNLKGIHTIHQLTGTPPTTAETEEKRTLISKFGLHRLNKKNIHTLGMVKNGCAMALRFYR